MSDSSKITENTDFPSNEIIDEPLDPRIQIELERANAATIEINNLETQLDNAQKLFQITFTNSKQRLATLAEKLGRCVERARPYHNACRQAEEAQSETQKAAQGYQNSVELSHAAQENLLHAESTSVNMDHHTRHEYIAHVTLKVTQAERDKIRSEQIHEEKSKLYQEYEQKRIVLARSLTRTIQKSKSYFQEKVRVETELQNQKLLIEDVQKAIRQAKKTYRTALNNLEEISEEIHFKRQNQIQIDLAVREPGVGAERPDEFLEFANLELTEHPKRHPADDSSSNDYSNSSTNCLHRLSNPFSTLTTNNFSKHFNTQTTSCGNIHEQSFLSDRHSNMKPRRLMINHETPLLSHRFRTQKCLSDSNLNLITKT